MNGGKTWCISFVSSQLDLRWFVKVNPEKMARLSRFVWSVKHVHRPCKYNPIDPSQAKQLLFYYWISSEASWTELDLLDCVFFLNLVWNVFQHSLKSQPLRTRWWVFKYTLGQITLSRKQSSVSFPHGVTVVFGTATCSCQFSASAGQKHSPLCVFTHVCRWARPHTL